jgi:benzoate 4-monooxygenase
MVITMQLIFYVVPYLFDPYHYRRFPGPPLAGFTNWWMSRVVRTGHHSEIVQQLHARYGKPILFDRPYFEL